MLKITLTEAELNRIFNKITIDPESQCWIWTGAKDRGYGVINLRGTNQKIHRVLYVALVGPLADYDGYKVLDHVVCNNPSCCNPDHVKPVEQSFNVLRANGIAAINAKKTHCKRGHPFSEQLKHYGKGKLGRCCVICRRMNRMRRYYERRGNISKPRPSGSKHFNAKLTDSQVKQIRQQYEAGGISQYDLATEFGVSQASIWKVTKHLSYNAA